MSPPILLVDDDPALLSTLADALGRRGFEVRTCSDPTRAEDAAEGCAVVVTDLRMPGIDGLELARRLAARPDAAPVIVLTAFADLETAVRALRVGVADFLSKPVGTADLVAAVSRATRFRGRRGAVQTAPATDLGLIGRSAEMERLRARIAKLAPLEGTVLVHGETGTGKERVAAALHAASRRAAGPFVPVNCAALPDALAESELFGHVKGAFTDARTDRPGLFRDAAGGTLFLDEIGDLPQALQPKLLRALEVRRVRPVGGTAEIAVDVRVVAATHRDLEAEARAGRFRSDLYYRLDELRIDLPALRDHPSDVPELAERFLAEAVDKEGLAVTGFAPEVLDRLAGYSWPGNVRELRHVVYQAAVLSEGGRVEERDLPPRIRSAEPVERPTERPAAIPVSSGPRATLDEVERAHIERVLRSVGGNRTEAARILGCDRKTLYRKLKEMGAPEEP